MSLAQPDVKTSLLESVERRTRDGVIALAGREIIVRVLAFVAGVILARLLVPSVFGIFAIATFTTAMFAMFSELGLSAAFIRRPAAVEKSELNALFTFQLSVALLLSLVLLLTSADVAKLFHAPQAVWVIRALSISLVLSCFRTVPIVLAERDLAYARVARADVAAAVSYWLLALLGVVSGFGIWSLVWALLVSAVLGLIVLYSGTRWRPALSFRWKPIRTNLRFGLLYQSQSATHFAKDTLIVSLGGLAFGPIAVGYLTWALQLAAIPLNLTQLVGRVIYPALAKLHDDPSAFAWLLESTLTWTCRLSLPVFAVLIGLAPQIVDYIYGPRWMPALATLYLLSWNMVLSIATGILLPALYSLNRAGVGLAISAAWMVSTVFIALALIAGGMGFAALAAAHAFGTTLALAAMIVAARRIGFGFPIVATGRALINAMIVVAIMLVTGPVLVRNAWSLISLAIGGVLLGLAVNLWGERRVVWETARATLAFGRA